jgi:Protein of unknown function (DUF5672)/SEC-C motif
MSKLDLSDVALCAIDSVNLTLTARALKLSTSRCEFGDAILLSDVAVEGPFRHLPINNLASLDAYSSFVLKELPLIVKAPFVLLIQWDGYVLDPTCWNPEFRQYDYIGATWPWRTDGLTVGNGGFSMRSRKLLDVLAQPRFQTNRFISEDEYICRAHRALLESEYGIRFAPERIADSFSYEWRLPDRPTFGFHGLFNMWRHIDDEEMVDVVNKIGDYFIKSNSYAETLLICYRLHKFALLRVLYNRLRANRDVQQVHSHLSGYFRNEKLVTDCVRTCENLLGNNSAAATHSSLKSGTETINRNQPCPCGSGRKYKHCHGKLA